MSVSYRAVGWNRQKKIYDLTLTTGVVLYLGLFIGVGAFFFPDATAETLLIRALGTAAFILLHVILSIGPLARLNPRYLPLLYNRRHLGVVMFLLGLAHGGFSLIQFHSFGDLNPFVSILSGEAGVTRISDLPFQPLGLGALAILFLMAATSHDFWLANLTAPVWKTLHMLVYAAYALIVLHVAFGVLQAETSPVFAAILGLGACWIFGLHVAAGFREGPADKSLAANDWVECCRVAEIRENRAKIVTISGERVAIFKYEGRISAISNVCQHQNGPLGEGKIVDGCITCPWHGYQYVPETGCSPPPFTEKIPTFRTRVEKGVVWVDPNPLPPGTEVAPTLIDSE